MTPFEMFYGRKPEIQSLRIYGCKAFVRRTEPNLAKTEARAYVGTLVGYDTTQRAYRIWVPQLNKIRVSRDVTFDETIVHRNIKKKGEEEVEAKV